VDKFPEERRQRFIYRLKKVVVENQRHKDYQGQSSFPFPSSSTDSDLPPQARSNSSSPSSNATPTRLSHPPLILMERL
jgi:hypothetical protein